MTSPVINQDQTIADRIIEARKAKDFTQLDLAGRLGISRAAVGQWEISSTTPSITKMEEVAAVLDVSPEWLCYGVTAGETKVVYRSPARENIMWVAESTFTENGVDAVEGEKWGIPAEYLIRELRANPNETIVASVNSHAVEPDYEYGDKVFVDRSDKRPSPGGIFQYWDGIGATFAKMQAIPGHEPRVRIVQKGQDVVEIPLADITIIGRVKGRIHRG